MSRLPIEACSALPTHAPPLTEVSVACAIHTPETRSTEGPAGVEDSPQEEAMRASKTNGARVRGCEGATVRGARVRGAKMRGCDSATRRGAPLRTVAPLHPRTLEPPCRHQCLEQGRGALAHGA